MNLAVNVWRGREGSDMVKRCGTPMWEGVRPYLDLWDSAPLRTASTHWNVPGTYGPLGELFFFLINKKEPIESGPASQPKQ